MVKYCSLANSYCFLILHCLLVVRYLLTYIYTEHSVQLSEKYIMKAAIIILSDPKSGTDEALGRVFNALAAAYDFKHQGDEVTLLFQGAGTRWIGELTNSKHPAHPLFKEVKDTIAGVSCGCADVFGATEEANQSSFDLIKDNPVPHTGGLPSLRKLMASGYTILTF